jgi:DNA-binding HxlR family transcriptional regulator
VISLEIWDISYPGDVLDATLLLRGRWTVAVLTALARGELQYKDVLTEINEVEARTGWTSHGRPLSDRVLTDTLRRATQHGLIARRSEARRFGPVWYRLTPTGRSLLYAARPLADWARQHRREVRAALRSSPPSA